MVAGEEERDVSAHAVPEDVRPADPPPVEEGEDVVREPPDAESTVVAAPASVPGEIERECPAFASEAFLERTDLFRAPERAVEQEERGRYFVTDRNFCSSSLNHPTTTFTSVAWIFEASETPTRNRCPSGLMS